MCWHSFIKQSHITTTLSRTQVHLPPFWNRLPRPLLWNCVNSIVQPLNSISLIQPRWSTWSTVEFNFVDSTALITLINCWIQFRSFNRVDQPDKPLNLISLFQPPWSPWSTDEFNFVDSTALITLINRWIQFRWFNRLDHPDQPLNSISLIQPSWSHWSTVEFNFVDSTSLINLGDPCKRPFTDRSSWPT